jgi:hypothetical protein
MQSQRNNSKTITSTPESSKFNQSSIDSAGDRLTNVKDKVITDIARDELKLIQDAIFKQEEYCYSAYRYAFFLISGLTVALFNEKSIPDPLTYLMLGVLFMSLSIYLQLIYRESFYGAVKRSHFIQKFLRGDNDEYKGPGIYEALHRVTLSPEAVKEAVGNARFYVPNGLLIMTIFFAYFLRGSAIQRSLG